MAADLPGAFAVPGLAWPGELWPGDPVTGESAGYVFTGQVQLFYLQYLDLLTQHTLSPFPGQECLPYPVDNVPAVPADGRWEAVFT